VDHGVSENWVHSSQNSTAHVGKPDFPIVLDERAVLVEAAVG
jgi:hypothetical protein